MNLAIKTIELARPNAPGTEFSFEDTDLLERVNVVLEKNKLLLGEKNIEIYKRIDRDIMVNGDKLRLEELFDDLVNNAVKYSLEDDNITIKAKEGENFVTVSSKDNDMDMNKDQLDSVFEEFYKADPSRHDFDSSGLGLPICKSIVENMVDVIGLRVLEKVNGRPCSLRFLEQLKRMMNKSWVK